MLHILFVCNEYPPAVSGGIGTAVANLARGLVKNGIKVTVIGMYNSGSNEVDEGVSVVRVFDKYKNNNKLTKWYMRRLQLYKEILSVHKREPLDIIEWPDFDGWYLFPIKNVTNVVKVHGTRMSHRLQGLGRKSYLYEFLELRTLRKISYWIGVSKWFKDEWKGIANVDPVLEEVVYNPVNTEVFKPNHSVIKENIILYCGGYKKRKGVEALAKAAKIFLPKLPHFRLILMGFESDMTINEINEIVGATRNQIDYVEFQDQIAVASLMQRSRLYVMPSLYESCGNSWIEAMSCGVPVIGSTKSCGPEIVEDGITGLLSNPDSPEDIADKVIKIISSNDMQQRMSLAARDRSVSKFSTVSAVENSIRFYNKARDLDRQWN